MYELNFVKMQGVGNDFVLVDGRLIRDVDWSGLAQEVCERRFGIGADGLLVIDNSSQADLMMRMYNPDGTPDVCGNGLRCVARYARERLQLGSSQPPDVDEPESASGAQSAVPNGRHSVTIATIAGIRLAWLLAESHRVTVDMGEPKFAPRDIPSLIPGPRIVDYPFRVDGQSIAITALSTGTPHVVILREELPEDSEFVSISRSIEHHPLFPERTSVMWCKVESESQIRLRIWERATGETLGCGTGACAASVASIVHGLTASPVMVGSKGGELEIEWREGDTIRMTGPAEYVFEGAYPL